MSHIEQVAKRLRGLRDALDISAAEVAKACGIDEDTYLSYETGNVDIPVSFMHRIAHEYGVELPALLFGKEPRMNSYFVTRSGKGEKVERSKAYSYQALAGGFANRILDPFMVTVEPSDGLHAPNSHKGQEFNYVIEGSMELTIGDNKIILEEGDSIMFDASRPHKMRALNDKSVKFIAIIA